MSVVQLAVPFVDTYAAALRWSLDDRPRVALAIHTIRISGFELELRVLGASHQVIARDGPVSIGEIVACGDDGPALPASRAQQLAAHDYVLTSVVRHASPAAVARLVSAAARHDRAVVASYPGDGHAVTVIAVDAHPDGVRWRTWHAYPRTAELVATRTSLLRR